MKNAFWIAGGIVFALSWAGCSDDAPVTDAGIDVPTSSVTDAAGDGAVPVTLTDGQIVQVTATVDSAEISQGNLAVTQASDARVRTYGTSMVTMHTTASAMMMALAQSNGLTPAESALSAMLRTDAMSTQAQLATMSGAAFDRAYVAAQVMQHAHVLDLLDTTLIPNATNAALRTSLQNDVRPMVASHLQQARDLQTALGTP